MSTELTTAQWREMREGITQMGAFYREFPEGIRGAITSVKNFAKSQLEETMEGLFNPLKNEFTQAADDIKARLGIDGAATRIQNSMLEVINSFTKMIVNMGVALKDAKAAKRLIRTLLNPLRLILEAMAGFFPWVNDILDMFTGMIGFIT